MFIHLVRGRGERIRKCMPTSKHRFGDRGRIEIALMDEQVNASGLKDSTWFRMGIIMYIQFHL